MLNYAKRCNIALGLMAIVTLTSCEDCNPLPPDVVPEYAGWQIGNVYSSAQNPSTYTNGFLESDCNNNHKMFVGFSGTKIDTSIVNHPVVNYNTSPIPANAITIDVTDGLGTDYLSIGGDTAIIQIAGVSAPRLFFNNIKFVKAGSSGPSTDTIKIYGYINLP